MAASSSEWKEGVARWSKVYKLGMEAALRESGCSEQGIVVGGPHYLDSLKSLIDTEPGILLATIGHGITRLGLKMAASDSDEAVGNQNGIGLEMASSNKEWKEGVAGWSRVCEVGMEAALREAGCSKKSIASIVTRLQREKRFDLFSLRSQIDTEPGRAALLATLGRGISCVEAIFSLSNDRTPSTTDWIPSQNEVLALCVNLSSNSTITTLDFDSCTVFGSVKGCMLLGHALANNSSVTRLNLSHVGMGRHAVRYLMDGLKSNKTLETLRLGNNPLSNEGLMSVAEFVESSPTLTSLCLKGTGGAPDIPWAEISTTLSHLAVDIEQFTGMQLEDLLRPLRPSFSKGVWRDPRNTALRTLELWGGSRIHMEPISVLISESRFLSRLVLKEFSGLAYVDWRELIFPALKKNSTLDNIDVCGCDGTAEFESLITDVVKNSSTRLDYVFWSKIVVTNRKAVQ